MRNQGPHGDLEKFLLPHLDAAYNLARWLVRDPSVAADIVQDAYRRAYRCIAAFRGPSCRACLLRIVRNAAFAALEARRATGVVAPGMGIPDDGVGGVNMDNPDPRPGPDATLVERRDVARLDDALDALPVLWRESLILRDVEALSYPEMAEVMDIPIGSVVTRLARARQALQRELFADTADGLSSKTAGQPGRPRQVDSPTPVDN